jgi:hypothetical protein
LTDIDRQRSAFLAFRHLIGFLHDLGARFIRDEAHRHIETMAAT